VPASPQPAPTPAPRRRATRRGEQTAERILDAAEARFAEQGYAGTHLRDVASDVGIRSPSLYNHFESKDDLHAAVLERGIRPVIDALAGFVRDGAAGDDRQRVLVEHVVGLLARRPNLVRLVQYEILTGGARLTPALRGWIETALGRAAEIVAEEPGTPPWPSDQIPLLVLAMFHAVVGYFTIAPLYRDLTGEDLLSPSALERQTRFLNEVVNRLLPDDPRSRGRR
jgi:AcrR family transcriptional regulator